mmetsp:Transcript_35711/g.93339  ORF Transcript_35711/g.93339 Transcript_35711/m.93339 type:complete len:212 (+) Transcript_35711:197-832(+)
MRSSQSCTSKCCRTSRTRGMASCRAHRSAVQNGSSRRSAQSPPRTASFRWIAGAVAPRSARSAGLSRFTTVWAPARMVATPWRPPLRRGPSGFSLGGRSGLSLQRSRSRILPGSRTPWLRARTVTVSRSPLTQIRTSEPSKSGTLKRGIGRVRLKRPSGASLSCARRKSSRLGRTGTAPAAAAKFSRSMGATPWCAVGTTTAATLKGAGAA